MKKRNKLITNNILLFIISLVLGVLLAWQMKNLNSLEGVNLFSDSDQLELQEQIQQLRIANNELTQRNEKLNQNLQELAEMGNDEDAQIKFYQDEINRISIYAGLTDVKGPGAIIKLDESENDNSVDAASLLVIVNSLRANGAYAISINDQRVVALTEISPTGSGKNKKIIMNGQILNSANGYEIKIIAEPEKIQDFYSIEGSVFKNLQSKGVKVNIDYPPEVEILRLAEDSPAYRQNLLEDANTENNK